jgi:hypothetical protein
MTLRVERLAECQLDRRPSNYSRSWAALGHNLQHDRRERLSGIGRLEDLNCARVGAGMRKAAYCDGVVSCATRWKVRWVGDLHMLSSDDALCGVDGLTGVWLGATFLVGQILTDEEVVGAGRDGRGGGCSRRLPVRSPLSSSPRISTVRGAVIRMGVLGHRSVAAAGSAAASRRDMPSTKAAGSNLSAGPIDPPPAHQTARCSTQCTTIGIAVASRRGSAGSIRRAAFCTGAGPSVMACLRNLATGQALIDPLPCSENDPGPQRKALDGRGRTRGSLVTPPPRPASGPQTMRNAESVTDNSGKRTPS